MRERISLPSQHALNAGLPFFDTLLERSCPCLLPLKSPDGVFGISFEGILEA
jgi:hypothetical protein